MTDAACRRVVELARKNIWGTFIMVLHLGCLVRSPPKLCLPELVSPPYTKNGFSLLFIGPGNASLTTYVSSNHGNCPRLLATPPPLSASGSSPPSPAPSTSSTRGRTSTPRRSDLSLPPPSVVEFHPAVGIVAILTVMISYT